MKIEQFEHIQPPEKGEKITINSDGSLQVPDFPVIPFIEGDGIGVDVTPAMQRVVDHAVNQAYQGKRAIVWMEIFAGEKANQLYGEDIWLPDESCKQCKTMSCP